MPLRRMSGGVLEGKELDPNLIPFFFFSSFFLHVFCIKNYWEQRLRAALAMVKKKLHPHLSIRRQGKSHQPKSLWYETNLTPGGENRQSSPD